MSYIGSVMSYPCGVVTLAGNEQGWADGTGTNAKVDEVHGMTMSSDSSFVIFGDGLSRLRMYKLASNTVTTLIGDGVNSTVDGIGTNARVHHVTGVDLSSDDSFALLCDSPGNTIRKVEMSTLTVTTIAGSGVAGDHSDTGTLAQFDGPSGVALSSDDTFAVLSNTNRHTIRMIDLSTSQVTSLAGSAGETGVLNGIGSHAHFYYPSGVALSADDTYVLIADMNNHHIRKLVLSTGAVSTLAGSLQGTINGIGSAAYFSRPSGLALHPDGSSVFVGELGSGAIRRVYTDTAVVSTLAGSPEGGYKDGPLAVARLNQPVALALSSEGWYLLTIPLSTDRIQQVVFDKCDASLDSSSRSVLVVVMFAGLWILGALVVICTYTDGSNVAAKNFPAAKVSAAKKKKKNSKKVPWGDPAAASGGTVSSTYLHKSLMKYIDLTVPTVFRPRQSTWTSIVTELGRHHRCVGTCCSDGGVQLVWSEAGLRW